ncbi:MAG: hypothetical protein CV045_06025 [Cyanobacteria bacterium M5B4]|nr:MAG: hypothetical protein CV045_06025 [Cyanobacteria bacterium M5B4]
MIVPLFHQRVLQDHRTKFAFPQDLTDRYQQFLGLLHQARSSNEAVVYIQAVHDLCSIVLGYQSPFAGTETWELDLTDRIYLGYFSADRSHPCIEILAGLMPFKIEFSPGIDWLIMTDFYQISLYYREFGSLFTQYFYFDELTDREQLELFYALFCRRNLLGSPHQPTQARVYQLLEMTVRVEDNLSRDCYRYLTQLQQKLCKDIAYRLQYLGNEQQDVTPQITRLILYRLILLQGMTDRGLLPGNLLQDAYSFHNPYVSQPVWINFRAVFRWLDQGNPHQGITPTGITFFEMNSILDREIHIGDELCRQMKEISQFNLKDDLHPVLLSFLLLSLVSNKKINLRKWRTHKLIQQASHTWNYLNDQLEPLNFHQLKQQQFVDLECGLGLRLFIAFILLKTYYNKRSSDAPAETMPTDRDILKQLWGIDRDQRRIEVTNLHFYLSLGITPHLYSDRDNLPTNPRPIYLE